MSTRRGLFRWLRAVSWLPASSSGDQAMDHALKRYRLATSGSHLSGLYSLSRLYSPSDHFLGVRHVHVFHHRDLLAFQSASQRATVSTKMVEAPVYPVAHMASANGGGRAPRCSALRLPWLLGGLARFKFAALFGRVHPCLTTPRAVAVSVLRPAYSLASRLETNHHTDETSLGKSQRTNSSCTLLGQWTDQQQGRAG